MDVLNGIILGAVEGLTEFIPVSSSGHLIIAREVMGANLPEGLAVDASLQFAAILAVLVYFRKDFWSLFLSAWLWLKSLCGRSQSGPTPEARSMLLALLLGTLPGVLFGLLLETYMETVFRNIFLVALALLAGSLLMFLGERFSRTGRELSAYTGFWIGCFQALALVPGISRSGATIAGGLLLGLPREMAVRFGFLLSFPIILGSGGKKIYELLNNGSGEIWQASFLLSSLLAFGVGLASIHWLVKYLRTHSLYVFIWYRIVLALAVITFLVLK